MLLNEGISFDDVCNIFAHGECLKPGIRHDELAKRLRSVLFVAVIFFDEMLGECSEVGFCRTAISFVAKLAPRSNGHRSITLCILVVRQVVAIHRYVGIAIAFSGSSPTLTIGPVAQGLMDRRKMSEIGRSGKRGAKPKEATNWAPPWGT